MNYLLFYKDKLYEENNYDFNGYIDLNSFTKFIVLIGFLDCVKKYKIKITNTVASIITYNHKTIRFIDIINHTSGLEYNPITIIDKKSYSSKIQVNFNNTKNIYNHSMSLAHNSEIMGNYNYNHYSYNLLACTVYHLSGKHIDEYLNEFLLNGINYKWDKQNNIPIAGYGLCVHTSDMKKLFTKLAYEMDFHNFILYNDKIRLNKNNINHIFVGHSNFYYCKSLDCFLVYFGKKNFKELLIEKLNNIL